jgi:hypothetical protein
MEENTSNRVYYRNDKKKFLTAIFVILTIASLPSNVKCDMGDTISSLILFIIISIFICAGIGWWSRRQEGNK